MVINFLQKLAKYGYNAKLRVRSLTLQGKSPPEGLEKGENYDKIYNFGFYPLSKSSMQQFSIMVPNFQLNSSLHKTSVKI